MDKLVELKGSLLVARMLNRTIGVRSETTKEAHYEIVLPCGLGCPQENGELLREDG